MQTPGPAASLQGSSPASARGLALRGGPQPLLGLLAHVAPPVGVARFSPASARGLALRLRRGDEALAVIKSTEVMIAREAGGVGIPESRVDSPGSKVQSPKSKVQSPKSKVQSRESRVQSV